jgi:hypothetical protein
VRHPAGFPLPHLIKAAGKVYPNSPFVYQGFQLTIKPRWHPHPLRFEYGSKMSRKGFDSRPEFAVMGSVIKAEDLLNISHILCCCTVNSTCGHEYSGESLRN